MTKTKRAPQAPARLRRSMAYHDDPERATALWSEGFRPYEAQHLESGMFVAYRDTDIFRVHAVGEVKFARVLHVTLCTENVPGGGTFTYEVRVEHTGGETECDPEDEVWAKPAPMNPQEGS